MRLVAEAVAGHEGLTLEELPEVGVAGFGAAESSIANAKGAMVSKAAQRMGHVFIAVTILLTAQKVETQRRFGLGGKAGYDGILREDYLTARSAKRLAPVELSLLPY